MTILPQLQDGLVEAAKRRNTSVLRRLPVAPRTAGRAVAVTAGVAATAVLVILLGVSSSERPEQHPGSLPVPSADVIARSEAMTRAPAVLPSGRSDPTRRGPLSAAELSGYVALLQRELPYPPGYEDDLAAVIHPPTSPKDMSGISFAADARTLGEYRAWCTWQRYWLQANSEGNSDAEAAAVAVLAHVADWPTFRGGLSDQARQISAAAAEGDAGTVRTQADRNCRSPGSPTGR